MTVRSWPGRLTGIPGYQSRKAGDTGRLPSLLAIEGSAGEYSGDVDAGVRTVAEDAHDFP